MQKDNLTRPREQGGEDGFLLVALIVAIFLVLLALSVAAPRIAMQMKREREVETVHRANQYVRAIQLYYRKFGHYPASIDDLKKTNNQRFLRQEYVDPLTGKVDWKLIRVGQNKTTVKGFFGQDLPGLPGGLGAAAGLTSGTAGGGNAAGGSATGSTTGSAFSNSSSGSAFGNSSSGSAFGSSTSGSSGGSSSAFGSSSGGGSGSSAFSGSTGGTGSGSGNGSSSTGGTGSGSSSSSSTGSNPLSGGGGPFMGIAVGKDGAAIIDVNQQTTYQDWEFLYDPRIELLKAKASLLGGGATGTTSGGLGSASGMASPTSTSTPSNTITPGATASPTTSPTTPP